MRIRYGLLQEFTQPGNFLHAKIMSIRLLEKDALAVDDEHKFIVAVRLDRTQMLDQFDGLSPTFHGERGLLALLQLPLELDDPGPLRERLAVTGDAGFIRVDHRGIRDDHLEYISVVRAQETSAQSSYPLKSENAIPPGDYQRVLVLVLALREKGRGAENTEHRNGCRNEGTASDTRHGSACFYLLCLLFLRHRFRQKFGHLYFPSQKSL